MQSLSALGPANNRTYNRIQRAGFVAPYEVPCNVRLGSVSARRRLVGPSAKLLVPPSAIRTSVTCSTRSPCQRGRRRPCATTVEAALPVYECDLPPAVANDGPLNSTSMDTSIGSPTPMVVPGAGTP